MDLLNKNVKHIKFGVGTITNYDEKSKTIFVKFQNINKEKALLFPDSFDKKLIKLTDLTISDSESRKKIIYSELL